MKNIPHLKPLATFFVLCLSTLVLAGCGKRAPLVFSYERLAADGGAYTGSGNYAEAPWACVRDLRSTLMWEVKTPEPGLHHEANTYTWFFPDNSEVYNRGDPGKRNGGQCTGSDCDTSAFIEAVNEVGLCGYNDWRVPTKEELGSIVDPRIKPPGPTLSVDYFPNTGSVDYWSSSIYSFHSPGAWTWSFHYGMDRVDLKENAKHIRLVRGSTSTRLEPPRGPKN